MFQSGVPDIKRTLMQLISHFKKFLDKVVVTLIFAEANLKTYGFIFEDLPSTLNYVQVSVYNKWSDSVRIVFGFLQW